MTERIGDLSSEVVIVLGGGGGLIEMTPPVDQIGRMLYEERIEQGHLQLFTGQMIRVSGHLGVKWVQLPAKGGLELVRGDQTVGQSVSVVDGVIVEAS